MERNRRKHKWSLLVLPILMAVAFGILTGAPAVGAEEDALPQVLITNVNVWDGTGDDVAKGIDVLVEGNLIKQVAANIEAPGAEVIDGKGRTLMPGLIDMHSHITLQFSSLEALEGAMWDEVAGRTVIAAHDWLMDGFTTVRDAGGMNGKGLAKMINASELPGPRIFPSGAIIGQTSGHSELRTPPMRHPQLDYALDSNVERLNLARTADGRAAVLATVRQNLKLGASQIKIMAGGGVATQYDPWESTGFTLDEMKAAVEAASDYGTYVAAHVNQPYSMQRCLKAGVISIEHGFVMDEETIKMIVEKGAYLSTNMTGTSRELFELPSLTAESLRKLEVAQEDMKNYFDLVKKYQPKMVLNIDAVLTTKEQAAQQRAHEIYLHAKHFGNLAMLKAATSTAGELLALSGPMNPYKFGKIGVIEPGAYADMLLVDGNPLEDISVIGANELWYKAPPRDGVETINLIMKDGKIYKNTL